MTTSSTQSTEVPACRREFPERDYERCGKPAVYIFWGKLFDKGHLGPRCEDCAADHLGWGSMARITDYAVYRLPDLPALLKQGAEEERERLKAVLAKKRDELNEGARRHPGAHTAREFTAEARAFGWTINHLAALTDNQEAS